MFACVECGSRAPRWEGRCFRCGAWGSIEGARDGPQGAPEPVALGRVGTESAARLPTGLAELDRVLGGGMVPGGCVLVGGEPGIGKSTLLLGMCGRARGKALYVAGEESPEQVALRARRLGLATDTLFLLDSRDTRAVAEALRRERPQVCVVDSVQSLTAPEVEGGPGGPAQMRAAAEALVAAARDSRAALFLVGQVTKEGGLAGPRLLEHAVDSVLLFEGDRRMSIRALRAVKNRYGPTDEIGLFEMREDGLREVRNASDLLLLDRRGAGPGSVVAAVVEGRRPLCVEVQALLVGDKRPVPRHRANGADPRRAELLVGVLVSHYHRELAQRDVYVNVVGGLTVRDTGLDLAVAAAVLGFHKGRSVDPAAVVIGEVGLRGEVRPVTQMTARLKEARAMGFRRAYVPRDTPPLDDFATVPVTHVHEVLEPAPV